MTRDPVDKQALQEMAAAVDASYYDDFRPALERYLRLSRNKKFMANPVNHLALQLAIAHRFIAAKLTDKKNNTSR